MLKMFKLWQLNRHRNIIYKYIKNHNGLPGTYYEYNLTASDILNKILIEQKNVDKS